MYKLGAAYNVFDGLELLKASINSIRDHVDYICIVFQDISNYGNPLKTNYSLLLNLGVDIQFYAPNLTLSPAWNEIRKRNIGREMCKAAGCTHFMTIDADEFYLPEEFKRAKEIAFNFDSSACQMLTYYKTPEYILDPPEAYYVPFIYKLDNREFSRNMYFPVMADPTRKLKAGKIHLFPRNELQMHHLSYVRNDIRQKLENSTARGNWNNLDKVVNYFQNWQYPQAALLAGGSERFYQTKAVKFPLIDSLHDLHIK
jgi:hypothetical protein